jgi:putative isomerase
MRDVDRYLAPLAEHVREHAQQMMREPAGAISRRYIVPSSPTSPYYTDALWDWDSWLTTAVLGQVEADTGEPGRFREWEEGALLAFLDHTDEDGVMPIQLRPDERFTHRDGTRAGGFAENMHKPTVAQQAAMLARRSGDTRWIEPHLATIERFLERYLESHTHPETGLAYWQSDFAIGVDNDPSVYYRPLASTASIYLNSLLYREELAYAELLERLGHLPESHRWRDRAQDLAAAMNAHLWDERDGTFYSADIGLRPIDHDDWLHQGAPRRWSSILLRVDSWSSFLPLWAGFASRAQADRMVENYRDRRTFFADYGVRSLSRLEKMYDLRASNNPSNWLGPIWGISNYLLFRGLDKYGYTDDARDIAEKTVVLFGRDLATSGTLHEFYHPDSGEPIMNQGFQSWNFLVLQMIAWLEGRPMSTEF